MELLLRSSFRLRRRLTPQNFHILRLITWKKRLHTSSCRVASLGSAQLLRAEDPQEIPRDVYPESASQSALNWHSALTSPIFASKEAFRDSSRSYSYQEIASVAYSHHLKLEEDFRVEKTIKSKSKTLHGKRIGIFTPHDVSFVISLWSTWLSGGIAVPLGIKHPEPQLEYVLKNSDTSVILCSEETRSGAERIGKACGAEILPIKPVFSGVEDPADVRRAIATLAPPDEDSALILYTSGTTGMPKGVLWKHNALLGQVNAMVQAWKWTSADTLLHVLPLYHLHGLINCLITPFGLVLLSPPRVPPSRIKSSEPKWICVLALFISFALLCVDIYFFMLLKAVSHQLVNICSSCGASVWMDQEFKAEKVWRKLLSDETLRINIFMAVPTIYVKLLEYYNANKSKMPSEDEVKRICLSKMRLMVSGSSPLPATVFQAWEDLTGHKLLERYGMTETGMILSNPIDGPRIPGTVGQPLPGVLTRIAPPTEERQQSTPASVEKSILGIKVKSTKGDEKVIANDGSMSDTSPFAATAAVPIGELQVSGPNMFNCYWNNEKATRESFTDDGWFRTGDTGELRDGVYRLLGRTSTEIIKSGGYKISALDIERRILEHPHINECAVFGIPDPVWGEKIIALVQFSQSVPSEFGLDDQSMQKTIAKWVAEALPAYTVPREVKAVHEIPRNGMGKINKKDLQNLYAAPNPAERI